MKRGRHKNVRGKYKLSPKWTNCGKDIGKKYAKPAAITGRKRGEGRKKKIRAYLSTRLMKSNRRTTCFSVPGGRRKTNKRMLLKIAQHPPSAAYL